MAVTAQDAVESRGLTEAEAAARLGERGPLPRPATSRSYRSIVRANTLTVFNAILAFFGTLEIVFGSWRDALFLGILVGNTAIGIGQEVRAKRALDRLAALVAPTGRVVRGGETRSVPVGEVVVGDLMRLDAGDQVVADGTLVETEGLALDESNLTGESEPATRAPQEPVYSGSFVAEGSGAFVVEAVGPDSRAERVTTVARTFRHERSPLERAMDRLLLGLAAVSVPLGVALVVSLVLHDRGAEQNVQTATAALVNMVPEGLILLVSLTAAVSAAKMARRGVLAQQLNAIESLASVDLLCTDKTGTLTEARLRVVDLVPAAGETEQELARALGRFAASAPSRNSTLEAIAAAQPGGEIAPEEVVAQVPFSSRRRWSALTLGDDRLVLGAPEALAAGDGSLAERAERDSAAGRRVLAIAASDEPLPEAGPDAVLPSSLRLLGMIVLAERLRPDADRTVAFFTREEVELKVLSGDAPATVGAIARDAGVAGDGAALNGGDLPADDDELRRALERAPAVGRISPEGKERVVATMKAAGRYVGMLGDGVNDVPALKAARLAIAQGTGTQMAKSVADLVLVSGEFREVPRMVGEGRQILRNIQRVARLFITKTVVAAFLLVTVGLVTATYPLLPRHFTLGSTLTIGIPAFLLALAPSSGPWRPDRFLANVLRFSVPAGLALGAGVLAGYAVARGPLDLSLGEARTVALGVLVVGGLAVVIVLEAEAGARWLLVGTLCGAMALLFVAALLVPASREFFSLTSPNGSMLAAWGCGSALAIVLLWAVVSRIGSRRPRTGSTG
jgi:magnesium-transporting ATPase (P-type)